MKRANHIMDGVVFDIENNALHEESLKSGV